MVQLQVCCKYWLLERCLFVGYKTRCNYVEAVTWQAESNFILRQSNSNQHFEKEVSYASFRLLTKATLTLFPLPIRWHKLKFRSEQLPNGNMKFHRNSHISQFYLFFSLRHVSEASQKQLSTLLHKRYTPTYLIKNNGQCCGCDIHKPTNICRHDLSQEEKNTFQSYNIGNTDFAIVFLSTFIKYRKSFVQICNGNAVCEALSRDNSLTPLTQQDTNGNNVTFCLLRPRKKQLVTGKTTV